ncbi:unnamed protein product [Prorocentrum cordatum]|uniref:Uncharacterized protein n=1 Tax=Prorocentrum cordatum TaxID=2364126 RepID=A0ABN9WYJ1_9DINO|nr:unnamed protein product [Polarella glacialis]
MALFRNMVNKLSNVCTREDMQQLQNPRDAHDEHFASLEIRIAQIEGGTSVKITAAVEAAILTKLEAHAQLVLSQLPATYSIGAEISAKNMQISYSIRFSSPEIASNVVQHMKSNGVDWIDPRTKVAITMRCRLGASAEARARRKALGRLWQALLNHMKENNMWKEGYRLGCNGPRGILFILFGQDDVEVLASLTDVGEDSYTFDMKYDSLQSFGIDRIAAADRIAGSALE